jgi:recombination protein RecR
VDLIERLSVELERLPGIGRKSATRLVYYLLRADPAYVDSVASLMRELRSTVGPCAVCGNYTDRETCSLCDDPQRERSLICVVEDAKDVRTIEETHEYHGLYHVLGGAISPIDGVGPKDLRIDALLGRIRVGGVGEVIVATNPTVEGETTAQYVARLVRGLGVKATRLAFGLPVGGDLEYADRLTLARALKGRNILE